MCNCTDGIATCTGCNGWGVVNPKGKRYRVKCKAIPAWAVRHDACNGVGMVACGCRELAEAERAVLAGEPVEVPSDWADHARTVDA